MTRFFGFLGLAIVNFLLLAAAFIAAANLNYLPLNLSPLLLKGFLPFYLFTAAMLYGFSGLRPGGSVLLSAAFIFAAWYGSVRFCLPFRSALINPVFLTTAFVAVIGGEICGKAFRRRKIKKEERSRSSAPQI